MTIALIFTALMLPALAGVKILAALLGLFVVAIALPFAHQADPPALPSTVSRHTAPGWRFIRLPAWADWCWGNDKYGAEGNWFWHGKTFWRRYVWLALRNPANNLQRYRWFRFDTDPDRVRHVGSTAVDDVAGLAGWQVAWQGLRAGLYAIAPLTKDRCLRIRLGYKINPASDAPSSAAFSFLINPWANFGR